ncbi:MAG: hypothetical protein ACKE9I_07660 [Methylophagaceae bacterium]
MKVFSFRNIRVVILLSILAMAAIYTQEQRLNTTAWFKPIEVTIFPINGDNTLATEQYITQLSGRDFQDIDDFFARGAKQYHLIAKQPIATTLGKTIQHKPPTPPENRNSIFSVMMWSLNLRYWAWKNTPDNKTNTNRIRLYVLYHQAQQGQSLEHSLGLQKGLIGVIHAFADKRLNPQNALVMSHEVLHTVGAIDKYDYNNQPVYPIGYADPSQTPLYPQRFAEIMAGRIPVSERKAKIPKTLRHVLIGEATAKEINWLTTP